MEESKRAGEAAVWEETASNEAKKKALREKAGREALREKVELEEAEDEVRALSEEELEGVSGGTVDGYWDALAAVSGDTFGGHYDALA